MPLRLRTRLRISITQHLQTALYQNYIPLLIATTVLRSTQPCNADHTIPPTQHCSSERYSAVPTLRSTHLSYTSTHHNSLLYRYPSLRHYTHTLPQLALPRRNFPKRYPHWTLLYHTTPTLNVTARRYTITLHTYHYYTVTRRYRTMRHHHTATRTASPTLFGSRVSISS